ncbi:unnamed protein product [Albugo candida]|uniref:Agenet domain-containing protein n=1 Tax=Albugo candida TaxID=65357 RepID=A0A024GD85_9STRA|nr:unnamed protein product [Albugo candida]|eukprot:CCI44293.1 unnamed protein product [Albugo candida]
MAQREQGLRETNTDNSNDLNRNYRVEDGEESLQIWHVGLHVERSIDNVWFPAVIVGTDQNETYSLQYEDEGIIETEVPKSEMRSESIQISETAPPSLSIHDEDNDCSKQPVVTVHQHGESSTSNGLRGIRWLQVNTR